MSKELYACKRTVAKDAKIAPKFTIPAPSPQEIADIAILVAFFRERNFPDTKVGNAAACLCPYLAHAERAMHERMS